MNYDDLNWLAGFLEAKAHFTLSRFNRKYKGKTTTYHYPRITINHHDKFAVDKITLMLGVNSSALNLRGGFRRHFRIRLDGELARSIMRQILPLVGPVTRQRINAALAHQQLRPKKND